MGKTKTSPKFWAALVIFSLVGQIAWVMENMYFNVFILNGECSVLHDGRHDRSRPYYLTNLKNKKVALIKRRQGSRKRGYWSVKQTRDLLLANKID